MQTIDEPTAEEIAEAIFIYMSGYCNRALSENVKRHIKQIILEQQLKAENLIQ